MQIGDVVQAMVTRVEPDGLWLEAEGKTGLFLVKDISHGRVTHPAEFATAGDTLEVVALRFNFKSGDFIGSREELHPEER